MKIEKVNIDDIKMADYNPRIISTDELQKLENSINEFGLVDPIIVNLNNNTIIGGHQRFKVLKKQNINELKLIRFGDIGWIFSDENIKIKDEDSEKALNIALNKISGEWDTLELESILEELKLNDFDVELTGFDEDEFEELQINNINIDEDLIEDDNFNEITNELMEDDSESLNITFNNNIDEEIFYDFINKIKKDNETISETIINYLEEKLNTYKKYKNNYEIIFNSDEEKERYNQLLNKIDELVEENKSNIFLSFIKSV